MMVEREREANAAIKQLKTEWRDERLQHDQQVIGVPEYGILIQKSMLHVFHLEETRLKAQSHAYVLW